jgi:hypothetical protein
MRARAVSLLAVAAVVAAGLAAGATTPVSARPRTAALATWTITPGGSFVGIAGTTQLIIARNGATVTCTSSRLTGVLFPDGSGQITTATFTGCTIAPSFTITVQAVGPWPIQLISHNPVSGVTTGRITNVVATLSGPLCSARVSGLLDGTYTNSTAVLRPLPNNTLILGSVSGCFGLLRSGDSARLDATYTITPRQTITSP